MHALALLATLALLLIMGLRQWGDTQAAPIQIASVPKATGAMHAPLDAAVALAPQAQRAEVPGTAEWTGQLHGAVVDADSGVGQERVELFGTSKSGVVELLESGPGGAFAGSKPFPAGRLELELRDAAAKVPLGIFHADLGPEAPPLRLEVRIGPLVRFTVGGTHVPGAGELLARVQECAPDGTVQPWKTLRPLGEDALWIRYPPRPWKSDPAMRLELWVADAASTVLGTATFEPSGGKLAQVHVELGAFGTVLRGMVIESTGRPLSAWIQAFPLEPQTQQVRWPAGVSHADGSFILTGLTPGAWRLRVYGPCGTRLISDHHLVPGDNEARALVLPPRAGCGAVAGDLLVQSPEVPLEALLRLHLGDGSGEVLTLTLSAAWSTRAAFSFQDVPAGSHVLEVQALDGREYLEPRRTVQPGATSILFESETLAAEHCVALRVLDSEGKRIDPVDALLQRAGNWIPWRLLACSGPLHKHAGVDAQLVFRAASVDQWLVLADGYRPWVGRAVAAAAGIDGLQRESLVLERGFGRALLLQEVGGNRPVTAGTWPVPDVAVLADGAPVATSDAQGLALVALAAAPARIELAAPQWVLASPPDLLRGNPTWTLGASRVQLVRR